MMPVNYDHPVLRILNVDAGQCGRVDQLMYGEIIVNDCVFQTNSHGIAVSVQPRVMRDASKRVESVCRPLFPPRALKSLPDRVLQLQFCIGTQVSFKNSHSSSIYKSIAKISLKT
ncbi:hypothetical protein J3459_014635 [Metarhizium acridum]|nr:hypothetical protein J3459_014635 [Metarhizium acridum]